MSFTPEAPRQTVDDLARAIGSPKSSAYRYLAVLRDVGLAEDDGKGGYQLTVAVARLTGAANAVNGVREIAHPFMERLGAQSRETVLLYKRIRDRVICVELIESTDAIRLSSSVGRALPIDTGAAGRVLLAYLPKSSAVLRRKARSAERSFETIRKNGYAVSLAEVTPDVWAVAAPIFEGEQASHSLVIAGPAFRLDGARRKKLALLVKAASRKLSAALSGRVASS